MLRLGFNKLSHAGYGLIKTNCKQFTFKASLGNKPQPFKIETNLSSNLVRLPTTVHRYIEEKAILCQPDKIHLCDGSDEENQALLSLLEQTGAAKRLANNK